MSHTGQENNNSSPALARRRLLKGAMAASPAVFTLQSGAARAALSNAQCLANPPAFSKQQHGIHVNQWTDNVESPNWKREPTNGIEVGNQLGQTNTLIPDGSSGAQQRFQDPLGNAWVSAQTQNGLLGYVLDGRQHDAQLQDTNSSYFKQNFYLQRGSVTRYKVVTVDNKGNYVKSSAQGNPVTLSCWTSFTTA